jgi:hypothetical protein
VYAFILCLCCPDELITHPRSPTVCNNDHETDKSALCSKVGERGGKRTFTCLGSNCYWSFPNQENRRLLWTPRFHYRVLKDVLPLNLHFFEVNFNIILPSTSISSNWPPSILIFQKKKNCMHFSSLL